MRRKVFLAIVAMSFLLPTIAHAADPVIEKLSRTVVQPGSVVVIKGRNFNKDVSKIRIEVAGKKYGTELDPYFDSCHMACDSLAMHRLNMVESSTLKSKEYVARGIPFVFSAPDRDLESVREFLYDAGSCEADIDLGPLIEHYRGIDHQRLKEEMHACASQVLDWDVKVKRLRRFVEEAVR